VGVTAAQLTEAARRLLPRGAAWTRSLTSRLTKLLKAAADEMERVFGRADDLQREMHPGSVNELLDRWEKDFGLPGPCIVGSQTFNERLNALVSKFNETGGQSEAYFIARALELGYTITVTYPAAYTWQINAPAVTLIDSTTESDTEQPLWTSGNALLECVMNRIKPAHSVLLFNYS
jgi:uncharacterized protein YmfQ (DUF2313 family)